MLPGHKEVCLFPRVDIPLGEPGPGKVHRKQFLSRMPATQSRQSPLPRQQTAPAKALLMLPWHKAQMSQQTVTRDQVELGSEIDLWTGSITLHPPPPPHAPPPGKGGETRRLAANSELSLEPGKKSLTSRRRTTSKVLEGSPWALESRWP